MSKKRSELGVVTLRFWSWSGNGSITTSLSGNPLNKNARGKKYFSKKRGSLFFWKGIYCISGWYHFNTKLHLAVIYGVHCYVLNALFYISLSIENFFGPFSKQLWYDFAQKFLRISAKIQMLFFFNLAIVTSRLPLQIISDNVFSYLFYYEILL